MNNCTAVILFYSTTFYCLELRLFTNIQDYIFSTSTSYKGSGMSFMVIFCNQKKMTNSGILETA